MATVDFKQTDYQQIGEIIGVAQGRRLFCYQTFWKTCTGIFSGTSRECGLDALQEMKLIKLEHHEIDSFVIANIIDVARSHKFFANLTDDT